MLTAGVLGCALVVVVAFGGPGGWFNRASPPVRRRVHRWGWTALACGTILALVLQALPA